MPSSIPDSAGDADLRVRLADPVRQLELLGPAVATAVTRVMASGSYLDGTESHALEADFARWIGRRSAVVTASGNAALEAVLHGFGIGPGDAVAVAANLDISAVAPVVRRGADLVWVDLVPGTTVMDPSHLAEVWQGRIKAVLAVHTHGHPVDLDAVVALSREREAVVIEDLTHAPGAWVGRRRAGAIGDAMVMSCAPTKPLGAIGNLGIIALDDPVVERRAREFCAYGFDLTSLDQLHHGRPGARFRYVSVGINGLAEEIQAAVVRLKLPLIDAWADRRRAFADRYRMMVQDLDDPLIRVAKSVSGTLPAPRNVVLMVEGRDRLLVELRKRGIAVSLNYVPSLHRQSVFGGQPTLLPTTDELDRTLLCLPCSPESTEDEIGFAVETLEGLLVSGSGTR
jgi:dTDP-4-amino-4,6-dideoxygalactose transaminase